MNLLEDPVRNLTFPETRENPEENGTPGSTDYNLLIKVWIPLTEICVTPILIRYTVIEMK
jgi:hypothetical protein